jgi:ariadne-1
MSFDDDDDDWGDDADDAAYDDDGDDPFGEDDPFGNDDDNTNNTANNTAATTSDGVYTLLQPAEIAARIERAVGDVTELLGISGDLASLLLRLHGWQSERFISTMLDGDTVRVKEETTNGERRVDAREHLLRTKGLWFLAPEHDATNIIVDVGDADEFECPICYDDVAGVDTYANECGHRFCQGCWRDVLSASLAQSNTVGALTHCPGHKCGAVVPDAAFATLLSSPSEQTRFAEVIAASFVQDNAYARWCPAADCDTAVLSTTFTNQARAANEQSPPVTCDPLSKRLTLDGSDAVAYVKSTVDCSCGYAFCFNAACGGDDATAGETHEPVHCSLLEVWRQKCAAESGNAEWIILNTRKCPACTVRIEKNQVS